MNSKENIIFSRTWEKGSPQRPCAREMGLIRMKPINWIKNNWETISKILRFIEVLAIGGALVVALFAYCENQADDSRISDLETTRNQLMSNQTILQGNITQLLANLTELQAKIYNLENWTPNITITEVQPIVIGPTQPLAPILNDSGRIGYNGTLNFRFTALASSPHSGKLIVYGNSFWVGGNLNLSGVEIGFVFTIITAQDKYYTIAPNQPIEINGTAPFSFAYVFSSQILQYSSYNIGKISCQLAYYDEPNSETTSLGRYSADFVWNNQTS